MARQADIERAAMGASHWNQWAATELAAGRHTAVDFSGHEFHGASLRSFVFPGVADFSDVVFDEDADFIDTAFHGDARFSAVCFKKGANFANARFFCDLSFARASVNGDAWFTHAEFEGQAWFIDAYFLGSFEATDAIFNSDARFVGTRFRERAWFHDTVFCRGVWFSHAKFERDARFVRARFNGGVEEFSDTHFAMAPDFRVAHFKVPLGLQRATISYAADASANLWQRWLKRAADDTQAGAYRRLKQLAAEAKDHERELRYFSWELRAKRFYETTGFGPLALNVAYDWIADYGRSVARPLCWWLGLIVISMIVLNSSLSSPPTSVQDWGAAAIVVVSNSALLLGSEKWLIRLEAVNWICPTCSGKFALGIEALFYIQSGLSLLLFFLVGLGLRNRFRIGTSS